MTDQITVDTPWPHTLTLEESADVGQGAFTFPQAPDRARALGEIHSRPFVLVDSPRVIFQLAFMLDGGTIVDRTLLAELSNQRGIGVPTKDARHHVMAWGPGTLRWEQHTEFSTWFWDGPVPERFGMEVTSHPFGDGFRAPGSLISGIRLEIRQEGPETDDAIASFDPAGLCQSVVSQGRASVFTDFRQNGDGLTAILIVDRGLTRTGLGSLVHRILDIETYRTLATLGLPLAQTLSPEVRRIEDDLTSITQQMKSNPREDADALLTEMTTMSADLEANAALSSYRFGASRAYYGIVEERIRALSETPVPGFETLGSFLERRLAPALRTCQSLEERQANLSRKLTRANSLVRSWIDVELERQNAALLSAMNRRAELQLRLQQTVEGLSVAAISYYLVGLFGYLAKAVPHELAPFTAESMTGLFVPLAFLVVWLTVRRVRRSHRLAE